MLTIRKSLAAAAALACFFAGAATAQEYPARPITVIVPFAAGGPTDVITRIVGDHMSKTLGQQLVIENTAGAGGTTGSTRAKRASPDGYTIMTGHMGTHAASVALFPNLAYHPANDFEPIGLIAGTPVLILARKDFPAKDLKEFVAYVKANEDEDEHGARGRRLGVIHHLPAAQLHHGREAHLGAVQRHRSGDERAGRRTGRLYVRPDRQRRAADQWRHHQGLCDRHAGA